MTSLNFEDGLKRLESIVEELEKGNVPLEESLKLFEEGVKLSQLLSQRLAEVEKRVMQLKRNEGGVLNLEPLDLEVEEREHEI